MYGRTWNVVLRFCKQGFKWLQIPLGNGEVIINVFMTCMVFHYMMNDNEVIENLELAWQDQKIIKQASHLIHS